MFNGSFNEINIIIDNTGYRGNNDPNLGKENIVVSINSGFEFSADPIFYKLMLGTGGLCAVLILAIILTFISYNNNKKKLHEFI